MAEILDVKQDEIMPQGSGEDIQQEQVVVDNEPEPQQQDPPTKELYNKLSSQEYGQLYTNTYDQFIKDYGTPEGAKQLHSLLSSPDYEFYTDTEDSFINDYFPQLKPGAQKEVTAIKYNGEVVPSEDLPTSYVVAQAKTNPISLITKKNELKQKLSVNPEDKETKNQISNIDSKLKTIFNMDENAQNALASKLVDLSPSEERNRLYETGKGGEFVPQLAYTDSNLWKELQSNPDYFNYLSNNEKVLNGLRRYDREANNSFSKESELFNQYHKSEKDSPDNIYYNAQRELEASNKQSDIITNSKKLKENDDVRQKLMTYHQQASEGYVRNHLKNFDRSSQYLTTKIKVDEGAKKGGDDVAKNVSYAVSQGTKIDDIPLDRIEKFVDPKNPYDVRAFEVYKEKRLENEKQFAIDITTERALKNKGISAAKGTPAYLAQRAKISQSVNDGNAVIITNPITGKPDLAQGLGFIGSMAKGWEDAWKSEDDAYAWSDMTTQQKVDYAKKVSAEVTKEGYMGEAPSGTMGEIGSTIGAAGPFVGKTVAATVAASALIAAAPETFGGSLAAVPVALEGFPTFSAFAATTPAMVYQGAMNRQMQAYMKLKEQNPNANELDLMKQSESSATLGAIEGGLTNLAFTGIGAAPLTGAGKLTNIGANVISNESKSALKNIVGKIVNTTLRTGKETLKAGVKMGAIVAPIETTTSIIQGAIDPRLQKKPEEYSKELWDSGVNNLKIGMLLHFTTMAASGALKLPVTVNNLIKDLTLKEYKNNPAEIDLVLQGNVELGNITQEVADKVKTELQEHKNASDKVPESTKQESPEVATTLTGLIEKKNKAMEKMSSVDSSQMQPIQEEINSIDKRIDELNRTGDPDKVEYNSVGDPLSSGEKVAQELPEGQIKNTDYSIKNGEVFYQDMRMGNPDNLSPIDLIKADIKARLQDDVSKTTDQVEKLGLNIKYNDELKLIEDYDKENISRVSGGIGEGEAVVEAQPVETRSAQEISGGGDIQEKGAEKPQEVIREEVKPIRQLGTGQDVYFETDKHRVNDTFTGKILLNIGSKESEVPMANIEFDTPNEAVFVAKRISELYPQGVPEAVLIDKVVDGIKNEYKAEAELPKAEEKITSSERIQPTGEEVSGTVQPVPEVPQEQKVETRVQPSAERVSEGKPEATAPVLAKEGELPLNKDTKAPFETKSKKQIVKRQKEGGLVEVTDKNGNKVSRTTEKKALREYANAFDFSVGKNAEEVALEKDLQYTGIADIIDASENPLELAEIYVNEEPTTQSLSATEMMIGEFGVENVLPESFKRYNDKNNITLTLAKTYLGRSKSAFERLKYDNRKGLDVKAQEMSHHYFPDGDGTEISPEDIANFMVRFPDGKWDKLTESENATSAADKFQKLTGLILNREIADIAIKNEFEKATNEERKLFENEYKTQSELEADYWDTFAKTDGFTKEIPDSQIEQKGKEAEGAKPTEPIKPTEPTAEQPKKQRARKEPGRFESSAIKIAEKIKAVELLPDFMKAEGIEGVKKSGLSEQELKELLADAVITMGRLMDKGVEFSQAIKVAIKDTVKALGEDRRESIEKGFEKYYRENIEAKTEEVAGEITEAKIEEVKTEPEGLITKEELSKYDEVKKLFESEGKTKWNDVVERAVQKLIKDNPKKTIEESAQNHANKLASLYDKGEAINPTAEDLAIINIAKLNVDKKINELDGWDSQDATERQMALLEFDKLNNDLINIAKAANPREAGLAFNIRQMILSMGEDGLKMRRMDLANKKGEPLSESDMKFTREQWLKEKELNEKKNELEKQALKDEFDSKLKEQEDKYNKLLKQKEKVKEAQINLKNRQELLKQKGKELADRLRKGIVKGTYSDPFLIGQSLNLVITKVADLVEGGFSLAAAIDKYVSENKLESKRQKIEDAIFDHINRQELREKSINSISEEVANTGAKKITKEMVSNNSIKDFIDSYVNTTELDKVSDVAFKRLKELLPDITKDEFKKAYLKKGEYKPDTSKKIKNEATDQKRLFNRLTSLQDKLGNLKKKGDLEKEGSPKSEEINAEIKKVNDDIQKELINIGKKPSSKSKLAKEGYQKRAEIHDKNIDKVSAQILDESKLYDLTEADNNYLNDILKKLKESKIDYNAESKLDQSLNVEKAIDKIDLLQKQIDKTKKSINKDLIYDLELGLQKIKDRFESTKKETDQSIMLEQAKQNATSKIKELERKLSAKEFDDAPSKKILTKSDAELAKINKELNTIKSAYDKKADEYKKSNRSAGEVLLKMFRDIGINVLIGMPKTFVKLTLASPLKIAQTYLSKLTFGRISEKVFNEGLIQAAKEAGESSSRISAETGLKAVFKNANSRQLETQSEKNVNKYIESANKYESALNELDNIKSLFGEESSEYIKEKKKVDKLKSKSDRNLLISAGDILYQYIGGSTLKTALEKLQSRNTEYERSLGEFGSESWTKVKKWSDVADNISYIFGYIGRSHGALKSISARYHVAAGFMARLEAALAKGEDVTDFNKLQEIAADSYTDWESGMYQQENWVTTKGNEIVDGLIKSDKKAARIVGNLLSWDVAITKVPVNIINESIIEMAIGLPLSIGKYTKEYQKAKRIVTAEMPRFTAEEKAEFKAELSKELSKMDKKTAATIVRMFRHGGFGLGILGLGLAINAKYGGPHHLGEKKEDEKKREGELKTGEISIGNTKLNKYFAAALDHTSSIYPFLAYQNILNNYKKSMSKEKGTAVSLMSATEKQLEHIIETYPQAKIVNPIKISKEAYKSYSGASKKALETYLGVEFSKEPEKTFVIYQKNGTKKREATQDELNKTIESSKKRYEQALEKLSKSRRGVYGFDYKKMKESRWGYNQYGNITIDVKDIKKPGDYRTLSESDKEDLHRRIKSKITREERDKIKY